jgi:hypothetical protein
MVPLCPKKSEPSLPPQSNTTQTLKAPVNKDAQATYFATTSALVQLSSTGSVSYLPIDATNAGANSNANWAAVSNLPVATPASPSASSSGSASGTATAGAQPTNSASDGTKGNGAVVLNAGRWMWSAVALMVRAALF